MEHNSRGNQIVTMTTVVAQSPSCDWIQGADNESNQIKSNPSITYKATTTETKDGSFRV
jgi:uncharacterized protein with FMN-binding domain